MNLLGSNRATRSKMSLAGRHARVSASSPRWGLICLLLLIPSSISACARSTYRQAADRESYCLIESRELDTRWQLPNRPVEPQQVSRLYTASEVDCGPKPQDDPAAKRFMDCPDGWRNTHYYDRFATKANTENPIWVDYLPRNQDGKVELDQQSAVQLGLLHSREYQTQFENVYLTALNLSGNRFEFETQWFGGLGGVFSADGRDLGNQRFVDLTVNRLGFDKNLAGGGEMAVAVVNGLTWEFGSNGFQQGQASLVAAFTQPLLRGAFRHVRLESLTQAERDLLYSVRDFARFRRLFYVDLSESYLRLLTLVQAIRNTESNVENLRKNLTEHEFYALLKIVQQVQVDQVFQSYQQGRASLLSAEQAFIAAQDQLKLQLGLPPWVPLQIDESLLDPFELVDPNLVRLQAEAQLFERLVQYLPPTRAPLDMLENSFQDYLQVQNSVAEILPKIESEFEQWLTRLEAVDSSRLTNDDQLDMDQQRQLSERIRTTLSDLRQSIDNRGDYNTQLQQKLQVYRDDPPNWAAGESSFSIEEILRTKSLEDINFQDLLADDRRDTAIEAWQAMEDAVGRRLRDEIAELYVAQTQIRLFLIEIEPYSIASETAITFAHQNRLDLMNTKAQVVDAFRRVEVAADALQSDLSIDGSVAVGSDPNSNSAFSFDSKSNRYRVGVQFDGPLNRLNERNAYRARQIEYQRASRQLLAGKDQIANEVRAILRQLELSRLNFQIARQRVVAAARQVDQAQVALSTGGEGQQGTSLTLNLLLAQDDLLNAKNDLIGNWVSYRIQKLRLFAALDMLYLDGQGTWINEQVGLQRLADFQAVDPEYFPPALAPDFDDGLGNLPQTGTTGGVADPIDEELRMRQMRDSQAEEVEPELLEPAAQLDLEQPGVFRLPVNSPDPAAPNPANGIVIPSVPISFGFGD
ncbi:MAG: TolC family protein [bacterium]|nr:TolC family protein [bacterium]